MDHAVYIMASGLNGTLYIGSSSDLKSRVWQHKNFIFPKSFTSKYNVTSLVYYELFDDPEIMVNRERDLKKWNRSWKIRMIRMENPRWVDLSERWWEE
jgi:putative endonuclease